MNPSPVILSLVLSFALGAIPTGILVAGRLGDIDIRSVGSGNVGATNVFRAFGWKWGLAVFAGDMAKGLLAVLIARGLDIHPAFVALAGVAAVCGHIWNPWLRLRGGKGVATAFGAMLGISPSSALVALAVWGVVLYLTRTVSKASLAAAAAMPLLVLVFRWGGLDHVEFTAGALALAGLVFFSHRENIKRIREGTEPATARRESD